MLRKLAVGFLACAALYVAFSAYSRRERIAEVRLPAVTHRVYLDVEIDGQHIGRIVIGLYGEVVPKTAKPLLDSNNMKELVDPSLDIGYDPEEMALTLAVASMCIHHSSSTRPSMRSVIRFFKGDRESLELAGKPKIAKPLMFDSCGSEDYTRSRYLNDLDRHKQLALEQ